MSAIIALTMAGLRSRGRAGTAVLLLVLVIAATGLTAGVSVARGGEGRLDDLAERTNVPDVVVQARGLPAEPTAATPSTAATAATASPSATAATAAARDGAATLAGVPGVRAVAGPQQVVDGELVTGSGPADLESAEVAAVDDPDQVVGASQVTAGRWLDGPGELVVERSAATHLGLVPGSAVTLRTSGGADVPFTVVGTATDLTDCAFPDCDPIRMFASSSGARRLDPTGTASSTRYLLDAAPGTDPEELAGRLQRDHPDLAGWTNTWPDTRGDILVASRIFGRFVSAFGVFLLVACAIVIAGTMTIRVIRQRREIAMLGAVGCRPREIVAALVGEHLVLGLAAAAAGWVLGSLVSPLLDLGAAPLAGRPAPVWSVADLLLTAGVLSLVLVIATISPAVRAARAPVTEALRDSPSVGRLWSRGPATRVPARLSLLGLGPLATRPARTGLSTLAVVVAVVGLIVTGGFLRIVESAATDPFQTGSPWDVTVSVQASDSAPAQSAEAAQSAESTKSAEAAQSAEATRIGSVVRSAPGVASWYAEADRPANLGGETVLARAFDGGPPAYQVGAGRLPLGAGEVAVGYGLVADHGLKVGSTVAFEVAGATHTARVVGWYRTTEDTGDILLLPMAELRRTEPGAVARVFRLTAGPSVSPAALADQLSEAVGDDVPLELQDSSTEGLAMVRTAMLSIAGLVAAVALVNLLSTLLAGNRENGRALGVLGALGLTPRQLVGQGAVAGAALGVLGLAVGIPLGLLCFRVLSDLVSASIGMGPGYGNGPGLGVLLGLVVTPLACAAAGGLAARVLAARPVSHLLRWD
ncbi:putative ABC transport system permease protein [Parafrankia irregularis]|uniref:Putative ABC transport system permease protein n=1 Tax=Parafrankia irregularis TaxID=795642 RepID=A0A0S4QWX4_9ACTN|nr:MULTISPECIES: FtsX-like permease family protein [Parafrankia]MBE3203470.1 FtsX-like permease family protein [Parafrankia sp. CH37]CUU60171.1 putative ABC transport system permease protein [Parafrankia irregularis]